LRAQLSRRGFVARAALAAAATPVAACATSGANYGDAVAETWRPFAAGTTSQRSALRRELIRHATLAPSSHDTQCWKFKLETDRISILPDLARRCPVVDPDDHHLFISLGCAAENLVIAGVPAGEKVPKGTVS
jgi:hypothetical protein